MNPLSLLTSTIRRVAAKVRAYLAQPLETQLWRLHQDIASKLGPVSLDFTNNDSIPGGIFLSDQRLTASLLVELLQQVQVSKSYWSSCDVILACPFTIDSARATFGEDKCVCLRNSDNHDNVINAFSVGTVGSLTMASKAVASKHRWPLPFVAGMPRITVYCSSRENTR